LFKFSPSPDDIVSRWRKESPSCDSVWKIRWMERYPALLPDSRHLLLRRYISHIQRLHLVNWFIVIAVARQVREESWRLTSLLTAHNSFSVTLPEISLKCARGARFGPYNHADPTNRGFILTIDHSPQQSDRRFHRYTVLRRHWTGITSICAHKVRQGETRSRADGGMEAKTIACASGSSFKLGIKLRQQGARNDFFSY